MEFAYLERQLLACFLHDPTLIEESKLRPDMMEHAIHRLIFQAMAELYDDNKALDQVTLLSACYQDLIDHGGIDFLNTLKMDGDVNQFDSYQSAVLEGYQKRSVQAQLQQYLARNNHDIEQLMHQLERIADQSIVNEPDVKDVLVQLYDEPFQETDPANMVTTGLHSLDKLLIGFEKKTSIIIGARPSMGKTALMLKLATGAAKAGVVPIIFSLEMNKKALLKRLISSETGINGMLLKQSRLLSADKKQEWANAIGEIDRYQLEIFDNTLQTTQDIRANIRRVMKKHPGRSFIVFIDYLTKIQTKEPFPTEHLRITAISDQLKAIAKDYNLPVVTLAQLSREVEKRHNKRPLLSDLRESGSIEQDADVAMLLYREDYYDKQAERNRLEIQIAKNRDGAVGSLQFHYNKATGVISEQEDGGNDAS
ncbi:hypothetical protein F9U64_17920 [Gracilibacillus oryzae]|uniref:DNA 5'-3' helicase n=1 Tax=Gracilibacillus oryzae TaxID=1672701 RepID=A0A7C8GRV4_9BACI|nr:DnaB-like helicase C-terminal domain-containing protein [Gracilibacillus oryzae]KAB8127389.1 hypothetical protein F9U64_17920 [Gracilibacillus oryzae]